MRTGRIAGTTKSGDVLDVPRTTVGSPLAATARKRRPVIFGVGALMSALAMFIGALVVGVNRKSIEVLSAATDIPAGVTLRRSMLQTATLPANTSIDSISFARADAVVGKITQTPIARGRLIVASDFAVGQSAPAGTLLVGMVLDPGALPIPDLRFGDHVEVALAAQGENSPKVAAEATIWRIWGSNATSEPGGATLSSARRVVTLAVPRESALEISDAASRDEIRLILVPNAAMDPLAPTQFPKVEAVENAVVDATTNQAPAKQAPAIQAPASSTP